MLYAPVAIFQSPPGTDRPQRPTVDEAEILARLRRSDQSAFDVIFRTWYAALVRSAGAMIRDSSVAEELVQDVMLELWRRRENLLIEGSFQAYLFRATRNRALNFLRHARVEREGAVHVAVDDVREASAPAELVAQELDVAIRHAITELTPRCREIFELSRTRGLKYSEIAETLGVSVKAVEAQMTKALKHLRERLAPWLPAGAEL